MKIRKQLIREAASLVNSGRMDEARILAGHIRLLQAIFKIPTKRIRTTKTRNLQNDKIHEKHLLEDISSINTPTSTSKDLLDL